MSRSKTTETLVSRQGSSDARGEKRSYIGNIFFNTLSTLLDPGDNGVFPADPFKSVITTLQCLEFSHDSKLYTSDNDETQEDVRLSPNSLSYLSLIALGETNAYSLGHLQKLVSAPQLGRIVGLSAALRQALGSLQTTVKTRGVECVFMDVPVVTSCLAEKFSQPRYHMQELIVEGVITNNNNSPFDDCINLYVRRILEEAFQAEQSEDIVSSYITVLMGRKMDKKQIIDVRHISSRRQQVVSILKAATVGEGEVTMGILIKLNRSLEYYDVEGQEGAGVTDNVDIGSSTGFMKITRRYHFSYRDDKGFNRCFARYPFDSLARGIFLSDSDILLYRNVYRAHASKVTRQPTPKSRYLDEDEILGPDEPLFLGEVSLLVKETKGHIKEGEFVHAGDRMLVLESFFPNPEAMLAKVSLLMAGDIGRVHSARNSLAVLMEVSNVLEQRILEVLSGALEPGNTGGAYGAASMTGAQGVRAGNTLRGASTAIISLVNHFKTLSQAHVEFKRIILTLVRDIKYSEFQSIKAGVVHEMWELFDEETRIMPIIDASEIARDRQSLVRMVGMIRSTFVHLHRIKIYLHVIEASIGSNVMLFLIRLQKKHSREEARQLYHWTQLPTEMRDLLGYIDSFDKLTIMTSGRNARTVSRFLNAENLQTQVAFGLRAPIKWDEIVAYIQFSGLEANFLWASTTVVRPSNHFAEFQYDAMKVDELARHEAPKFMVEEAAKVRYLVETHVLRALQEAAFGSFTRRSDAPLSINANISINMTRFSNYLTISNNYEKDTLVRRLFTTARIKGAMHLQPGCYGACKIKIVNRFINSPKAKYSSGGVFGANRILTALGYNAQNIFTHVWMIPPLFATRPNVTPGLSMSVNIGISARSAFHWGMPKKKFHNPPDKAETRDKVEHKQKRFSKMDNFYTQLGVYSMYHFPEPFELEVVLKYSYELSSTEPRCRKSFGYELSRCCSYLSTAAEWKLNTVTIPHLNSNSDKERRARNAGVDDDDDERDTDFSSESVYTCEELEDRGANLNMQVMAGKHTFAVLNCAVLFPDHATGREDELLDMVSKVVSTPRPVTEEQPDYDRTATEQDRIFADDTSACGAIQRYLRERKVPRPYVPCRINFTMIATERVRLNRGKNLSKFSKKNAAGPPSTADGSSRVGGSVATDADSKSSANGEGAPKAIPGLAIGQHAINRLIARTIWFSPQACKNVWACTNGEYKRCYAELAETELENYRQRKLQGRHLQALDHLQMNSLLTCQYDIFLECAVRHSTVVSSLQTIVAYIESTRSLLMHNPVSTINLNSLQRTLLIYVGLGLRMVMLAPDCVQLRGGCFLILHRLQKLEQLLHLMPEKLLLPDKTEFASMDLYAESQNNIVSKEGVVVDNAQVLRNKEFELRRAMGSQGVVENAVDVLDEILAMSHTLLESLGVTVDADLQTLDMRMKFKRMTLRKEGDGGRSGPREGLRNSVFAQAADGVPIPKMETFTFSNADDPNATFDSSKLDGSEDATPGQRKGYQLPASLKLLFSTDGMTGKPLEDLMEARRDWIQREQYEEPKDGEEGGKNARKYRPLLEVAMADSRFNSKSTRLMNLTESAKDRVEDQGGGEQGPLLPVGGRSAKRNSIKSNNATASARTGGDAGTVASNTSSISTLSQLVTSKAAAAKLSNPKK